MQISHYISLKQVKGIVEANVDAVIFINKAVEAVEAVSTTSAFTHRSAMKYTQLDLEHKRSLMLNFQAATFAFAALESVTGAAKEEWIAQITDLASQAVDSLTDEQVEHVIQSVEDQQSYGVTHPWVTVVAEISK